MWLLIMCERRVAGNLFMGKRKWIRDKKSSVFVTSVCALVLCLYFVTFLTINP